MAVYRDVLTLGVTASAAITKHRFVTLAGAHCGAGAKAVGVSRFDTPDTKEISTIVLGTAVVEAGDAVTADDWVASDANGKAVTGTIGDVILGRALEAASAAGDLIEVQVIISGATHA